MKSIIKWIYPSCCPICDQIWNAAESYCCSNCNERLPWVIGPVCMKCGKPVAKQREYCGDCKKEVHFFNQGRAAFTYEQGIPDALYRVKYRNRRDYLDFFGDAMDRTFRNVERKWRPQVILPVPMHWKKKAKRGYNQSELLAVQLSKHTGIPIAKTWAGCVKQPKDQKRLGRKERRRNLRDCFQVTMDFSGIQRVLLVDDVYTTGSTMDELSRILKHEGVQEVYFIVLCIVKGEKDGMHETKSVLY